MDDVAIRDAWWDALRSLPQAGVVPPGTMRAWLDATCLIDPGRVEWHIRRAAGFGGSEAGHLLEWATRDDPNPVVGAGWGSVERLVRQKLLLLAPDPPGVDARRGIALEPAISAMFEDMLAREGRQWSRRDDLKSIVEDGPHPGISWMRASLDGLYEIDGELWIVDFKAPSEASLDKHRERLSMGYVAQLNHYAVVAAGRGVPVDRLALVMLDYRRFGDAPVAVFEVEASGFLRDRIVKGGMSLWHEHVLTGRVPVSAARAAGPVPAGMVEDLSELRRVKRDIAELMRRKDELSARVLDAMRAAGLEKVTVELGEGSATVALRRDLDAERGWERIAAFHADREEREKLKFDLHAPTFADPEDAARWVMTLRDAVDALPPGTLPASLSRLFREAPTVTPGKPLRNSMRQALRVIGEDPRDFEVPVLTTRFQAPAGMWWTSDVSRNPPAIEP